MRFNLPIPTMIAEAKAQIRFKRAGIPAPVDLIIETLIFILVFFVCSLILEGIAYFVFLIPVMLTNESFLDELLTSTQAGQGTFNLETANEISSQIMATPEASIAILLATIGGIAGAFIYCRFIERRKLATMGFRRRRFFREYLLGLLVGSVMFGVAVLIAVAAGSMSYNGLAGASALIIVLFFVGYMVQGMSEEVIFRGYFLNTLARRQHMAIAVFVSSCLFGAAHLLNQNVAALGIINIILFGCFMAVYMLKRGSIWGAAAIHSAWNFTQGNIFGISVSGTAQQPSIFLFESTTDGVLINGGAFGLEAGLAASIVLIIAIVIVLLLKCSDPAPRTLAGSDGNSQAVFVPGAGAQQLPFQPVSPEYWQPPTMQAAIGEQALLPQQQGQLGQQNWPPPPPQQ